VANDDSQNGPKNTFKGTEKSFQQNSCTPACTDWLRGKPLALQHPNARAFPARNMLGDAPSRKEDDDGNA